MANRRQELEQRASKKNHISAPFTQYYTFQKPLLQANTHQSLPADLTTGPLMAAPSSVQLEDEQLAKLDEVQAGDNVHESQEETEGESVASDESEMEPFADYSLKINELLQRIDFIDFTVSSIQHGYRFQNCVYALTSNSNIAEKYILRVPGLPDINEAGICEAIENDVAVLGYLSDKLPVPSIKAYSSMSDNVLQKPYTIQTRLPGASLDNVYEELTHLEKLKIIDQFVLLLAQVESIRFSHAGTFSGSVSAVSSLPERRRIFTAPVIMPFSEGDEEFMQNPTVARERAGPDVKSLLRSHIDGWIRTEQKKEESFTLSSLKFLISMVDDLDREGAFRTSPHPIVLYHWDLEPRNIIVGKVAGSWKIQGIIDWDAAHALPRVLTRRAPDWIWDPECEGFTGYLDNDHHPKPVTDLSVDNAALKAYFDAKAAETLDGYLEDAYGHGLWLRRIWTFAKGGADTCWYIGLIKELEKDWNARLIREPLPLVSSPECLEKTIRWAGPLCSIA
ncbi:MAG: hypothetical protein Q9177_001378 [Variospora cf. flavescens]